MQAAVAASLATLELQASAPQPHHLLLRSFVVEQELVLLNYALLSLPLLSLYLH